MDKERPQVGAVRGVVVDDENGCHAPPSVGLVTTPTMTPATEHDLPVPVVGTVRTGGSPDRVTAKAFSGRM
jgi:hypothetical protein